MIFPDELGLTPYQHARHAQRTAQAALLVLLVDVNEAINRADLDEARESALQLTLAADDLCAALDLAAAALGMFGGEERRGLT